MAQVISSPAEPWTAEDLTSRFGPIPLSRIVLDPAPGTATVEDVVALDDHQDRLCELIDGTLVRKPWDFMSRILRCGLPCCLDNLSWNAILVSWQVRTACCNCSRIEVRIPDVSFISHARLANSGFPDEAAPASSPDLAVEIISRSNTRQEMDRKLKEYFEAGARAVWYVYPKTHQVMVYSSPENFTELGEVDTLDGGQVIPGFTLDLKTLFAKPGGTSA